MTTYKYWIAFYCCFYLSTPTGVRLYEHAKTYSRSFDGNRQAAIELYQQIKADADTMTICPYGFERPKPEADSIVFDSILICP